MSDPLTAKVTKNLQDKKLILAAVNINSITSPGRIDELQCFVDDNHIDVLALSEVKIDSTVHPSLYSLKDFHPPIVKPRTRRGGGTGIYVRKSLPFNRMENLENDDIEAIWVKIQVKDKLLVVCSTYLPPHTPADKQSHYLEQLTDSVTQAHAHSPELIVILGDFNGGNCWLGQDAPRHSPVNSYEHKLKSTSEALGLTQLINTATRMQDGTHNVRDLIFINSPEFVTNSGILSSFSNLDHLPIFAALSITYYTTKYKNPVQVWDYKNADIDSLIDILSHTDWNSITSLDVDEAAEAFTNTLRDAANRCIPTKRVQKRHDKPWVTAVLRRQIRKRDRLFKIARNRQTSYDWTRWRTQRNLVTNMNRKLKNDHIQRKVDILLESKKDPYKYHSILRNITGFRHDKDIPPLIADDGTVICDDLLKANMLNSYFRAQTEIKLNDSHYEHLTVYKETHPETPHHLDTIHITSNEVLNILNGLDASKACGSDKIPTRFLKMVAIYVAEPLAKIFNKSLAVGKYPMLWKMADVKPVFKGKGSPSEMKNYRPISLLPCVSKIFEKVIFKRIYDHITSQHLLTDYQSGYRPGHNTELQLAYLTDKLYKALDQSEDFTIIYLDISRYFEKIWHAGLLAKCKYEFGIEGRVLCWLESYLDDRSQMVQIGAEQSHPLTLKAGVPQGSVLGPLLAIMYLNGLSGLTSNNMLYFADDSSLHCSHTPATLLDKEVELQNDLNTIYNYGLKWAITFNASKTNQQTFSNRRHPRPPNLSFGGQQISPTSEHKHLGLTFSADLKFRQQVNEVLLKFNRALSPLYQIACHVPRTELLKIYTAYVQPHLDYCSAVYDGNLTKFDSNRLEKAQNRAARLITGTVRRTPVESLRKELGWSSVAVRRRKNRLFLFQKLVYDLAIPEFIKATVPNTRASVMGRQLRNTRDHIVTQPASRTTAYSHSFIPSTTRIWNELPTEYRLPSSHKIFKKNIQELMGPKKPNPFNAYGSKRGNKLHTKLRLKASSLNAHKFSFGQVTSPQCHCGYRSEDILHYFLRCPRQTKTREDLFQTLTLLLNKRFVDFSVTNQIDILLNGPQMKNNVKIASKVAFAVQNFILKSGRFYLT